MKQKTPKEAVSPETLKQIASIGDLFAIEGEFLCGMEIESGHINTTYCAVYKRGDGGQDKYILQRINNNVFKDPKAVMRNVEKVTRHINWKVLRVKKDSAGQTLNLYPARGGRTYIEVPDLGFWRCYNFIAGTRTYDVVENTRQAYQAGFAFGSFQDLISDMNPEDIVETIPNFHNTRKRFERLMEVIELDPKGRVADSVEEIAFIKEREADVSVLLDLLEEGSLPLRITHNDTKINNVMMDEETDEAVCVIDLDTVMPGLIHYDFGDMVRTATTSSAEDEEDLSQVNMSMSLFEALSEGFMEATASFLTKKEAEYLAFSGKLITLEIAIRFLTDHLEGDVYFKIHKPQHNLIRAKNQLKLVKSIEEQLPMMQKFIQKKCKAIGK